MIELDFYKKNHLGMYHLNFVIGVKKKKKKKLLTISTINTYSAATLFKHDPFFSRPH